MPWPIDSGRLAQRLWRHGLAAAAVLCAALGAADAGATDPLAAAERLVAEGKKQAAVESLARFLSLQADSPRAEAAALRLAEITLEMGRPEARERFQEFIRRFGYADADGRGQYGLAASLIAGGEYAAAEHVLRRMIERTPNAGSPFLPWAELRLGWCSYRLGDAAAAEARFRRLAAVFEGTALEPRALVGLAACRLKADKATDAVGLLDRAASLPGDDELRGRVRLGAAVASIAAEGVSNRTLGLLESVASDGPPAVQAAARLRLGRVHLGGARYDRAADTFRSVLPAGPGDGIVVSALLGLGEALARQAMPPAHDDALGWLALAAHDATQNQVERALARFQLALDAGLEAKWAAAAAWWAAVCAERAGRDAEAVALYERELARLPLSPRAADLRLGAARCHTRLGRLDKARSHLQVLERQDSRAAARDEARLLKALSQIAEGKAGEAGAILDDLVSRLPGGDPLRGEALLCRARAYVRLGRAVEAAADLREYLRVLPADADRTGPAMELADALIRAGRAEEARKTVEALAPAASSTDALAAQALSLGALDERAGRPSDALARYEAALAMREARDLRPALLMRKAACLHALRRSAQAMETVRALVETNPAFDLPPSVRGWAALDAYERGEDAWVVRFGRPLLDQRPPLPPEAEQALFLLVRSCARTSDWPLSARAAGLLAERFPTGAFRNAALLDGAEALLQAGEPAKAEAMLADQAVSGTLRARWLKTLCRFAQGPRAEALSSYRGLMREVERAPLTQDWTVRLMVGLGRMELAVGSPTTAVEAFRRAVRAVPSSPQIEAMRLEAQRELQRIEGRSP